MDRRALKFMQKRYFVFFVCFVSIFFKFSNTILHLQADTISHTRICTYAYMYVYVCQCTRVYYCLLLMLFHFFCTRTHIHELLAISLSLSLLWWLYLCICYYFIAPRLRLALSVTLAAQKNILCCVYTLDFIPFIIYIDFPTF